MNRDTFIQELEEYIDNEAETNDYADNIETTATGYHANREEVFDSFIEILNTGKYDTQGILRLYQEDQRHLEYITGDPYDLFLENIENADKNLYRFVLDNNYLDEDDMQNIREDLSEAQLMDFDRAIGANEYEEEEDVYSGQPESQNSEGSADELDAVGDINLDHAD